MEEPQILTRVREHDARVGIIGLGYVGLPFAAAVGEAGFETTGFDVDQDVVDGIGQGRSHVKDVDDSRVQELVDAGLLTATTDFDLLADQDVIVICVPTPLSKTGDPDVSFILQATGEIGQRLRPEQLVILESTTYPGTTRELLQPRLEESGLRAGEDFFLAFSPERVDPGNPDWDVTNTPKILGGLTARCHRVAKAFYEEVIDQVVEVSSPESAELAKILENTFRAINIALANEMAVIADRLGIDVWEVIDAAATKPYGFMKFTPGPGLGGHCIPVDPHYLAWKMKTLQYKTRFIELAAEINAEMPRYVVSKVSDALNRVQKPVNGSDILLLGISYKPGVDDVRESPALDILQLLESQGAEVAYHDPHVPTVRLDGDSYQSVDLTAERLRDADLVVVTTDHPELDYDLLLREAAIVVDPRNALEGMDGAATIYPVSGPPRDGTAPAGPGASGEGVGTSAEAMERGAGAAAS